MKKVIFFMFVFACLNASAADVSTPDHKQLLQFLLGDNAPANVSENRTYYFGHEDQVVSVENSEKGITVNISRGTYTNGMNIDYRGPSHPETSVQISADKKLAMKYVGYTSINGNNEKFMDLAFNITSQVYGGKTHLTVDATQNVYWGYTLGSPDKEILLPAPAITTASAYDAGLILSLSDDDMQKMGDQAAAKANEQRTPEVVSCEMTSEYLMNCNYYLETDYSPDLMHTVFSIKDGKIRELLDVTIEPGC
jgi:hypothetical protein